MVKMVINENTTFPLSMTQIFMEILTTLNPAIFPATQARKNR